MSDHESGSVVDGRFEIVSQLGEGGMGTVYRAIHREMDRQVALKVLKASLLSAPQQQMRFRNEAQVISTLDHPNIVSIYSVGIAETGAPYIAMELLEGKPLSDIVKEARFLSYKDAVPLFIQACHGLEHAHEQGIIHRDIKPSNLVVMQHGDQQPKVKVVDFGIAKALEGDSITQTSVVIGSAFYLSPGQCEGRQGDAQSDIYALGCSMFEALTGRPPFVGDFYFETMQKHRSAPPPKVKETNPDADLPESLESIIACCLSKNVEDRYKSVSQVRADLHNILNGKPPQHIPQTPDSQQTASTSAKKFAGSRRLLITICSVIAVTAALTIFIERQSHQLSAVPIADIDLVGERDRIRQKNAALWPVVEQGQITPEVLHVLLANCQAAHRISYCQEERTATILIGIASTKLLAASSSDADATRAILKESEEALRMTVSDYQKAIRLRKLPDTHVAHEQLASLAAALAACYANQTRYAEAKAAQEIALDALRKAGNDKPGDRELPDYIHNLGQHVLYSLLVDGEKTSLQNVQALVNYGKADPVLQSNVTIELNKIEGLARQFHYVKFADAVERLSAR